MKERLTRCWLSVAVALSGCSGGGTSSGDAGAQATDSGSAVEEDAGADAKAATSSCSVSVTIDGVATSFATSANAVEEPVQMSTDRSFLLRGRASGNALMVNLISKGPIETGTYPCYRMASDPKRTAISYNQYNAGRSSGEKCEASLTRYEGVGGIAAGTFSGVLRSSGTQVVLTDGSFECKVGTP